MRLRAVQGAGLAFTLMAICVGCGATIPYDLSWTIDVRDPGDGDSRLVLTHASQGVFAEWAATGQDIRVLDEAPATPHDTLGILYWRHTEVPLKVNTKKTDCETIVGSVSTSRQCRNRAYTVTAQCGERCRRDIVRVVADSAGADAIIVKDERTSFGGISGQPRTVPESNARNEGFRATYVLIRSRPER